MTDWNVQDASRHRPRQIKELGLGKRSTVIQDQARICEKLCHMYGFRIVYCRWRSVRFPVSELHRTILYIQSKHIRWSCSQAALWFAEFGGVSAKQVHCQHRHAHIRPYAHMATQPVPKHRYFPWQEANSRDGCQASFFALHPQMLDCLP